MATDFVPHKYQDIIIDGIHRMPRGSVWASMGTGKTVSVLTAVESLSLVEEVYPILVVAPKRVARTVWPAETRKWNHLKHLRTSVISGSLPERQAALRVKADIYTTNFEQLPWLVEYLGNHWPFRWVIIDESDKLKGFRLRQGATRAKALARVAHTKIKRITLLTGTPSPNGLTDLWGQMWFVDKGERLGRTYDGFRKRWFCPADNGHGVKAMDFAQGQIQDQLKDVCITIDAADWFDLEKPIVRTVEVQLPPAVRVHYKQMEKKFFMELDATRIEAANAAAKSGKLLQIANGAAYLEDGKTWKRLHDEKLDALEEIVSEACGAPVLVGYNFKSDLARLKERFPDGIDLASKDGLERAQRGEGRIWFGHPASMGHGVDGLQYHCNIMVLFGLTWNLGLYLQFIERVGPMRQIQAGFKRSVFMYLIVAQDTIDEMVIERLVHKRTVQDILLAAMKQRGEKQCA